MEGVPPVLARAASDLKEHGHALPDALALTVNTLRTVAAGKNGNPNYAQRNEARDLIDSRLAAIGKAQDILVADPVEGAGLAIVVKNALEPHDQNRRISVRGDDIRLTPRAALIRGNSVIGFGALHGLL